ncbi:MAG: hypothetical protein QXY22_03375 [Candidatus Nitrosotenuis sp.]
MVFGWGKKKEETEKATLAQEIQISEIMHALEEHKKSRQDRAAQESKPRFETIKKEIQSIFRIINNLKDDDLNLDDVDNRIKVIAVRGKAEIVETITKEAKTTIPDVRNYESMLKCTEVCSHILKKIGDVLGKNSRIVHIFAKKYANDLKAHLETVTTNHQIILKMIQEIKDFESSENIIKEKIANMTSLSEELLTKISGLAKHKESLKQYENLIADAEKKLQELKSSKEYAQFLSLQSNLKRLDEERNRAYKEIDDEFSKISRPLGKYVYVTSLDKQLKVLLESLIQTPSGTLEATKKDAIITILESCMKGVISGTVSVKESEKTVGQITHLISILDQLIRKKEEHEKKIRAAKEQAGSFDQNHFIDLEKRLSDAKEDLDNTTSKIRSLESEIEQQTRQSEHLLEELSEILYKTLGRKYVVVK